MGTRHTKHHQGCRDRSDCTFHSYLLVSIDIDENKYLSLLLTHALSAWFQIQPAIKKGLAALSHLNRADVGD
jgi:hypothetical protein